MIQTGSVSAARVTMTMQDGQQENEERGEKSEVTGRGVIISQKQRDWMMWQEKAEVSE